MLYFGDSTSAGGVQEAVILVAPLRFMCSFVCSGNGKDTELPMAGESISKPLR